MLLLRFGGLVAWFSGYCFGFGFVVGWDVCFSSGCLSCWLFDLVIVFDCVTLLRFVCCFAIVIAYCLGLGVVGFVGFMCWILCF